MRPMPEIYNPTAFCLRNDEALEKFYHRFGRDAFEAEQVKKLEERYATVTLRHPDCNIEADRSVMVWDYTNLARPSFQLRIDGPYCARRGDYIPHPDAPADGSGGNYRLAVIHFYFENPADAVEFKLLHADRVVS